LLGLNTAPVEAPVPLLGAGVTAGAMPTRGACANALVPAIAMTTEAAT
jgi:hypothetical protein